MRTYEIESAELGGGLVQAGVGREDRAATLTLVADDTTHGCLTCWWLVDGLESREDNVGLLSIFA